jgi:hypothetical protein
MGIGSSQPNNAVYLDDQNNQYYTLNSPQSASNWGGAGGFFNPLLRTVGLGDFAQDRNYLGQANNQFNNSSVVNEMLARANSASNNVKNINMSSLFPYMQYQSALTQQPQQMQQSQQSMQPSMQSSAQSGAGRFL